MTDALAQVKAALTLLDQNIHNYQVRAGDPLGGASLFPETIATFRAALPAIDTLGEELARLRTAAKLAHEDVGTFIELYNERGERLLELNARFAAAESALADAKAEGVRLRETLQPLAGHYEPWMDAYGDDHPSSMFPRHTFGDIRRAVAALGEAPASPPSLRSVVENGPAGDWVREVFKPLPADEAAVLREVMDDEATPAPERVGEDAPGLGDALEALGDGWHGLPSHRRTHAATPSAPDRPSDPEMENLRNRVWSASRTSVIGGTLHVDIRLLERLLTTAPDRAADALREAVRKAIQLCEICSDWNLSEVQIDEEMVDTYDLKEEFKRAALSSGGGAREVGE